MATLLKSKMIMNQCKH